MTAITPPAASGALDDDPLVKAHALVCIEELDGDRVCRVIGGEGLDAAAVIRLLAAGIVHATAEV